MLSLKAIVLAAGIAATTAASPATPDQNIAAPNKAQKKGNKGDMMAVIFKQLDTNNDGQLSPAEFAKLSAMKAGKGKAGNKNANKANKGKKGNKGNALFKQLDTNNDGFLSLDEFRKLKQVAGAKKNKT